MSTTRMNQISAKNRIQELVAKYEAVVKSGQSKKYTEEETKKGFILPLFAALGWDVEEKEEVSAEENITGKRVDYGFRLDGRIKFYLEAKPLKADLNKEEYANQAVRYAWNKGVNWAILTDFESLKVFYSQDIKKTLADKLYFEIRADQYIKRFDQLWQLSREAFETDLIDKEAERVGKKLQKYPVTSLLYEDLTKCRELLTEELSVWNKNVSKDLLDEGIQKLLNRLIFIRVAEDRGIEPSMLRQLVREWEAYSGDASRPPLWQSMISKFRELDAVYNSNLFSEHPFEKWEDYNGAVKKVIDILYGKSGYYEYDFKLIPADVLGTVYEHYLGHRLSQFEKQKTAAHDARKRKEAGVYYTPEFIVDYIVKNALTPILDNCKSIDDLARVKVLDPACGSGSFLNKALEVINDKYKELGDQGNIFTKIKILKQNIYGVDLDDQAVEIARLNLLLNTFDSKIKLPELGNNVKNGNSLLFGTDEELIKICGLNFRDKKPFNWHEEFSEVFKQGGFSVIIGNPPYIKEYVNKHAFDCLRGSPYYQGKMDIWTMFASVSIDLLKDGGVMSFIAPNNWISNAGASIFREKMLSEGEIKSFVDFGDYKVFSAAGIQTMIYVFEKKKPSQKYSLKYSRIADKNISENKLISNLLGEKSEVVIEPQKLIGGNISFLNSESESILEKLESKRNLVFLDQEVGQGIVAAPDKYFLERNLELYNEQEKEFLKPFYTSTGRYRAGEIKSNIFYICENNFKNKKLSDFPNIERHFEPFRRILSAAKKKYGTPEKPYFYLHRERNERFFVRGPKIVCGSRVAFPTFFYTEAAYYGSRALQFLKTDRVNLKYLVAILNSKIVYFWLISKGKRLGDLLQVDKGPLLKIPIYVTDNSNQQKIILLVDKITFLYNELSETEENSNKWKQVRSEIEKVDYKINQEVYKLYNLTEEEIKIVEGEIK